MFAPSSVARAARALEAGRDGPLGRALSPLWANVSARTLCRHVVVKSGVRVIAVGGATLGGSGKTPLAIACARALVASGQRVAFVGHAYGAAPGTARVVSPLDDRRAVGDEAHVAASALASARVPVVVAPTRQAAVDYASTLASVLVLDGALQLAPQRAALSLLAVDGKRPWGSGACPPRGDLRASRRALLAQCDRVVAIGFEPHRSFDVATPHSDGAKTRTGHLSWEALQQRRIGLWTTIARPDRVRSFLADVGVEPVMVVAHADHRPASAREQAAAGRLARAKAVDLWLCTAKCAAHLGETLEGIAVGTLDYELRLSDALLSALRQATQPSS